VLEVGGVVRAGREQHHLRVLPAGRDLAERLQEPGAVVRDRPQPDAFQHVGEGAHHHVPVLDHVADAGRRARVVFQHHEAARRVADDIDAANVDVGAVRQVDAAHDRLEVGVAEDQFRRDHSVGEDLLVVVDVVQQVVQRGDPLPDPGLDGRPIGRGQHTRDAIEGQHSVRRVALRIHREGDAQVAQLGIGVRSAPLQLGE